MGCETLGLYSGGMLPASVVVSASALAFTIGSFYWLQARKGRLKLYPVATFSGAAADPSFFLRLPVMIYNTGAKPRVVSGLRLRFHGEEPALLECHTFRKGIEPKSGDTEDFFHPYVVPGRDIVTRFAHFRGDDFSRLLSDAPSTFTVEVQHDDKTKWKAIGKVEVHTEIMYVGSYIAYSNNPGVWPETILEDAKEWRTKLTGMRDQTKGEPVSEGPAGGS